MTEHARTAIAAPAASQVKCIHMTAEMAANCPTCNPTALRGLPTTPQGAEIGWRITDMDAGADPVGLNSQVYPDQNSCRYAGTYGLLWYS
jgi:hypothetical protein